MGFQQQCLDVHNQYRKKHGVPPLTLNATISTFSQSHAAKLIELGKIQHSGTKTYGENVYYFSSTDKNALVDADTTVKSWYDESQNYDFTKEPSVGGSGHFTQLVWKDSKELGVGMASNDKGTWYVVCNYLPPGNVTGQYVINVIAAKN